MYSVVLNTAPFVTYLRISWGQLTLFVYYDKYMCIDQSIIDAKMHTAHIYNLDSLASSNFAIETRCTSSGPSASLRVLAPLHMRANGRSSHTPAPPCTYKCEMLKQASTFCTVHWQVQEYSSTMQPFCLRLTTHVPRDGHITHVSVRDLFNLPSWLQSWQQSGAHVPTCTAASMTLSTTLGA